MPARPSPLRRIRSALETMQGDQIFDGLSDARFADRIVVDSGMQCRFREHPRPLRVPCSIRLRPHLDEALDTAFAEATAPTEDYLTGTPHLPEHLETGLEAMGIDVTDLENDLMGGH